MVLSLESCSGGLAGTSTKIWVLGWGCVNARFRPGERSRAQRGTGRIMEGCSYPHLATVPLASHIFSSKISRLLFGASNSPFGHDKTFVLATYELTQPWMTDFDTIYPTLIPIPNPGFWPFSPPYLESSFIPISPSYPHILFDRNCTVHSRPLMPR